MAIGIETIKGDTFKTMAIARDAKPTCDKPSPIIEYRFNTNETPNKDEQRAMSEPATKALMIKVYENNSLSKSNIGFSFL